METGLLIAQEESLAIDRLKASMSKKYRFEPVNTLQISNDGFVLPTMKVFFDSKQETVTQLSKSELSAIIKQIVQQNKDNQEMFQPINLAKVSPRTFWSIIKECGPDIQKALTELVPDYDWSFISHRKRHSSEKKRNMDSIDDIIEESKNQYKFEKELKRRGNKEKEEN